MQIDLVVHSLSVVWYHFAFSSSHVLKEQCTRMGSMILGHCMGTNDKSHSLTNTTQIWMSVIPGFITLQLWEYTNCDFKNCYC